MTRKLRALGLALAAAFAAGAVAASGAQATEFFHSHKEKTVLTGTTHEGEAVLELPTAPIQCKVGHYEGLVEGTKHGTTFTTETVTVHPIYTECVGAGQPAVVNTNNCHYKLFAATSGSPAMGNVEINECPSTAPITITIEALGIIVAVENQSIPNCYNSTNNKAEGTEKWDVALTATCEGAAGAGGIAWKCTKGKAACMTAFGASEGVTAKYREKVTINGFEYESGTTGSYKEGVQTGIWKGPEEELPANAFFHSHRQHTILTGEQVAGVQQTFTFVSKEGEKVPVECAGAKLAGTETGEELSEEATFTTPTITVHPEYYGAGGVGTKCSIAALEIGVSVGTGTCHYLLAAETVGADGQLKVECGSGAIELTLPNCVIKVPTQTVPTGGAHYESNKSEETEKWDFKLKSTAEGVKYTTNNGSGCKALGLPTEATNGTITGEVTLKGFGDKEKTETGTYKEGNQTGIWEE